MQLFKKKKQDFQTEKIHHTESEILLSLLITT